MTAPLSLSRGAPGAALTFDAVSEAALIAEIYSRAASDFAAIGDVRGLNYALRCAAAALSTAADAAQGLRSLSQEGAR